MSVTFEVFRYSSPPIYSRCINSLNQKAVLVILVQLANDSSKITE